jgi:rhodanese-related sulfurtransferase
MRVTRLLIIVLAGATLGLAWNAFSGRGLALTQHAFLVAGDEVIDVQQARRNFDQKMIFVDARDAYSYRVRHIPGALLIPEDAFDKHYPPLASRLRTPVNVIVYCSGYGCESSHHVARQLKERGIPALIFADGLPAWEAAGHPTQAGEQP